MAGAVGDCDADTDADLGSEEFSPEAILFVYDIGFGANLAVWSKVVGLG